MTPETPPPDDLTDHLRAAAFHLRMSLQLARSPRYGSGGLEGYRDRMAVAGGMTAGMTELAQVWVWVTERPPEFKAALRAAHCLRAEAWKTMPSTDTDGFKLAVDGLEKMLVEVDAKLEEMSRA